jgi:hypothetical protein
MIEFNEFVEKIELYKNVYINDFNDTVNIKEVYLDILENKLEYLNNIDEKLDLIFKEYLEVNNDK